MVDLKVKKVLMKVVVKVLKLVVLMVSRWVLKKAYMATLGGLT
jgi:hypothetical protein